MSYAKAMISKELFGVLVGGILPAVLFAISGITAKYSQNAGISLAPYILAVGLGVVLVGIFLFIFFPEKSFSGKSVSYAVATGTAWALGATLFAVAITKFGMPVAKVAPLNNTSTLFVILFGFILFSEWKDVNSVKLVFGALLVVIGSIFVSRS